MTNNQRCCEACANGEHNRCVNCVCFPRCNCPCHNQRESWEEDFDAMISGRLGGYGDQILYREKDIKSFISSLLKKERERMAEIIEECGHQQDDDTIWCNMDEVLKRITQEPK